MIEGCFVITRTHFCAGGRICVSFTSDLLGLTPRKDSGRGSHSSAPLSYSFFCFCPRTHSPSPSITVPAILKTHFRPHSPPPRCGAVVPRFRRAGGGAAGAACGVPRRVCPAPSGHCPGEVGGSAPDAASPWSTCRWSWRPCRCGSSPLGMRRPAASWAGS